MAMLFPILRGRAILLRYKNQTGEEHALPLRFGLNIQKLEGNAKTQLDPSATLGAIGGNVFGVDHAKRCRVKPVKRWVEEVDVVENVKEVRGDPYETRLS